MKPPRLPIRLLDLGHGFGELVQIGAECVQQTNDGAPASVTPSKLDIGHVCLARACPFRDSLLSDVGATLAKDERELLPGGLTPHSLRRTFASLLFALGESPPYVMAQMGHTTTNLTLAIYARQMDRRDGEPARLKTLVQGREAVPAHHRDL